MGMRFEKKKIRTSVGAPVGLRSAYIIGVILVDVFQPYFIQPLPKKNSNPDPKRECSIRGQRTVCPLNIYKIDFPSPLIPYPPSPPSLPTPYLPHSLLYERRVYDISYHIIGGIIIRGFNMTKMKNICFVYGCLIRQDFSMKPAKRMPSRSAHIGF